VDPSPRLAFPIQAEFHLYQETSGSFFERHDVRELFGGASPSLAFIDGLHEFPTVLADFANVEAIADENTMVVFHDMLPLDEITQRAERVHDFYTGDVWKMLHCLADARPTLSWFTVRTPPSGLTFVTGLDPTSTVIKDRYDELVEQYGALEFEASRHTPGDVVDNDWELVAERLSTWRTPKELLDAESLDGMTAQERMAKAAAEDANVAARITTLDRLDPTGATTIADLRRELVNTRVLYDHTAAELEAIRQARIVRWIRPLRIAWAWVRRGDRVW
jgi:hypothetical protein